MAILIMLPIAFLPDFLVFIKQNRNRKFKRKKKNNVVQTEPSRGRVKTERFMRDPKLQTAALEFNH